MERPKIFFICSLLALFFFSCANKDDQYIDPRGTDYAGAATCVQCHQTIAHHALQTAHFKATAPATIENILGDFGPNAVFMYGQNTKLVMEKRNDSLYQVLYKNGKEVKAYSFDIVFGGKNAQTSVYWHNNNTYELPISYYKSVHNWATSPGFSADMPYFDRKIEKDCYACHSSNISSRNLNQNSEKTNFLSMDVEDVMNKKTIIYGIDCERCHGPAKKHVEEHLKFPNLKTAKNMVAFSGLTNQQKLDACSICHSGNDGLKMKSRFEFKPGNNLTDFYRNAPSSNGQSNYDVHGNQLGLLTQSKCFTGSTTLNCITCHNPHEDKTQNLASFSKICVSCHATIQHSPNTTQSITANSLKDNCIDCHMPKQSSRAIVFQLSKSKTLSDYKLRTHRIAVYPAE